MIHAIVESFLFVCTIIGASVVAVIVIVPIVGIVSRHFLSVQCPECGHRKFQIMVGGPYKCRKCGWQRTQDWIDKNPEVEIKGKWWNASF